MAKVTITLEDQQMTGGEHIEITVASEPPLPVAKVTDPLWLAELGGEEQDLDMRRATPAQIAARFAVGEVAASAHDAAILVRSGQLG